MQATDPMTMSRYDHTCPYCHASIVERADGDTHILACSDRWRRQHHVDPTPGPGATPALDRWAIPDPVTPVVESSSELARRIIGSRPLSEGFRSFVGYEPTA